MGAGFPDEKVSFFTPGTESGTYDYFTEAVLETDAEQRTKDVQTSADDNQIVTGIEGTAGALGYVGFAFADSQKDKLKILAVDGGDGCVKPEIATIADGSYKPLSRPLFMYPSTETAAKPEVKAFVRYILDNNEKIVDGCGLRAADRRAAHEGRGQPRGRDARRGAGELAARAMDGGQQLAARPAQGRFAPA